MDTRLRHLPSFRTHTPLLSDWFGGVVRTGPSPRGWRPSGDRSRTLETEIPVRISDLFPLLDLPSGVSVGLCPCEGYSQDLSARRDRPLTRVGFQWTPFGSLYTVKRERQPYVSVGSRLESWGADCDRLTSVDSPVRRHLTERPTRRGPGLYFKENSKGSEFMYEGISCYSFGRYRIKSWCLNFFRF